MAYTFGANTNDAVRGNDIVTAGANVTVFLIAGWWYPTTLTATRYYASISSNTRMTVDTTTSQLRLGTDRVTTDHVSTVAANIVTGEWVFIAWLCSIANAGPAHRCWVGRDGLPAEQTVSVATAGSGNATGGGAVRCVANFNAGTLAFQGDIGQVVFYAMSGTTTHTLLAHAAYGTITQAEADRIYNMVVVPIWKGDPPIGKTNPATNSSFTVYDTEINPVERMSVSAGATQLLESTWTTPTIGGSPAWAANRQKGPLFRDWPSKASAFVRR